MNAPTPRKPLVVGWLYEGIVPPVFTDSVVIYREWLRQGHENISPVIRKSDADAYYVPDGEVRVECAPDPRGVGIGVWIGSRCIYSGAHAIPAKPRDWAAINAAVDEYLEGYELRVDEGCHTPTEFERFLILDAVVGLLADEQILALLSGAPAAGDARDADMYWNDADTERFAGTTLDDAVHYVADDIPTSEMPVTLTFQRAMTLPNVRVLVTGVNGDGELQYEVMDAAIAAQQGEGGGV